MAQIGRKKTRFKSRVFVLMKFVYIYTTMKKQLLIGMLGMVSLLFVTARASGYSTFKQYAKEGIEIVLIDDVKNDVEIMPAMPVLNFDAVAGNPVAFEFYPPVVTVDEKPIGKLKNKFHPWYLFEPVKLC
jgi:hypothetical protein